MGARRWWLVGIAALLSIHGLLAGLMLPSSFFIIGFCWLWVGVAALLDRAEDARAMSLTMMALMLAAAVIVPFMPASKLDLSQFFFLALLPSLVASMSTYALIRHIEHDARMPQQFEDDWFTEPTAGSASATPEPWSEQFTRDLLGNAAHDNVAPAPAAGPHGREPRQMVA